MQQACLPQSQLLATELDPQCVLSSTVHRDSGKETHTAKAEPGTRRQRKEEEESTVTGLDFLCFCMHSDTNCQDMPLKC